MKKPHTDPFLAQTSVMLAVLCVVYAVSGHAAAVDFLSLAR